MIRDRADRIALRALACIAACFALLAGYHTAWGNGPTLADRIAQASQARGIASYDEPTVDPNDLGAAIAAAEPDPDRAAMLLAIAAHESRLRVRLALNDCRPWECDHGLAWGLWQIHKTPSPSELNKAWGSPRLDVQAYWAAKTLRGQWHRCDGFLDVPTDLGALRGYAGHQCDMPLRGEADRLNTFFRIRSRL